MLTAVRYMLSKLVSPLWRTEEVDGEGILDGTTGIEDIRHLRGSVVSQLCPDYGIIDDAIYFTSGEVLGGVPLKEGDLVNCIAVRDGAQRGWKAVRVEKSAYAWEDGGRTSLENDCMQLRPLIGTVTSFDGDGGFINQTTYFPRSTLWDGYEPMKGDWVQAKYFINPTQWTTQAQSVAPLRYCRLDQVCVTSVYGNSGVVDDTVFFSLESLLLPANYKPLQGHLVNLVMVESSQSFYSWRALCMAPCVQSSNCSAPLSEDKLQSLLENKGGLEVTDYGQFGDLMIGDEGKLVLWIQNKGSDTHRLKCCDFAGWDSKEQFTLVPVKEPKPPTQKQQPSEESRSESSENPKNDEEEADQENGGHLKDTIHSSGVRREEKEVDIAPGERLSVAVACQAKSLGSCAELLLLHFSSFTIGRRLEVTVSSEEASLLQPTAPYSPNDACPVPAVPAHVITVTAPKDPPRIPKRRLPNFLPNYPVPKALRDCLEAKSDVLVVQPCLGEVLSPSNMHSRFSTLLWLEELHAERELSEFAINGALLRKGAVYLHLEVLGLAEGRPSLFIGDRIVLKKPRSDGMVMEYVSYVTEINDEDVSLRVNTEFQRSYLGEPLDVEFSFNRLTSRRCHNALEQTKLFRGILFPSRVTLQPPQWTGEWIGEPDQNKTTKDNEASVLGNGPVSNLSVSVKSKDSRLPSRPIPSKGQFFNPDLNPPQKEAVKRILAGEGRPTPYVLFGPPGTGKTITLIESILQVYHFVPSSRVLVCTPSNSAADLICVRLHHSGFLHAASLARVNATCRQEESIPEVLRQYSKAGEDIRHASFHRIVVSTCSSSGMFHNIGIQVGHFTHMFLDEAGQATEPEALIPMSLMSEKDGQIVLAGDPCQLGPVVKSKLARTFGLGVSLLERLMANPLYSRHDWGYNPNLVTKLIYNYRSHEALLVLPSKLFYQGELVVKAPRTVVDSLCQWKTLPKKGFPLLVHGVRGTEMREGNNPSWFNPVEAVQVMLYCCQLAKKLYNPVNTSDIGIIAPYRKQCEKIRLLLGKVGLSEIKVGSVEEFQGQEFLVIIVSTVRSNESVKSDDLQSVLGFLSNPKRFNVAVTRPKALLIIVGNPHILIMDPCFRALLQYCFINGAYVGCDPPPSLRDTQI
ncbi:RNA helicase Mov10l1 isoform X2 [Notolabrus celidotus]|uniref:RNA helicase Mov10l1 isoform X2 n=1 Tax=Notolabrus celidotus TaxID=1203425 RepID=UPI00149024EB|nr:RNA helicase Mov10l1 isoform X2 [Notolabrus celidotus]XP_034541307.1 RNA helicase Mov10l1 isoform X2 [Notolabrus celidotus]XP_034541308.1 RNA helicase Mov10l1 isoform X2 [Notolabrus celidotus]XP_034541311.1 RNA helicase Mov10l1 isoform X2 [Notolabrus celidotus]